MYDDKTIIETAQGVLKTAAESITNVEQTLGQAFCDAVHILHETRGNVIVCGIGKSGIIAQKVAATFSSTGILSIYIHPSDAFHGDFGMVKPEDTILMFSHSGETEELIKFLGMIKHLHGKNNKVITLTSRCDSSLAASSDTVILTNVLKENNDDNFRHIPTTSTTVTLALGDALAVALQKLKGFRDINYFRFHPGGDIGKIAKNHTEMVKPRD